MTLSPRRICRRASALCKFPGPTLYLGDVVIVKEVESSCKLWPAANAFEIEPKNPPCG